MKILSFDVGIINLAYCIVESENEPKILQWEIITIPTDKKFSAHISSVSDIYINLIKELDRRPILLDIDIVLIEKPPIRILFLAVFLLYRLTLSRKTHLF